MPHSPATADTPESQAERYFAPLRTGLAQGHTCIALTADDQVGITMVHFGQGTPDAIAARLTNAARDLLDNAADALRRAPATAKRADAIDDIEVVLALLPDPHADDDGEGGAA